MIAPRVRVDQKFAVGGVQLVLDLVVETGEGDSDVEIVIFVAELLLCTPVEVTGRGQNVNVFLLDDHVRLLVGIQERQQHDYDRADRPQICLHHEFLIVEGGEEMFTE